MTTLTIVAYSNNCALRTHIRRMTYAPMTCTAAVPNGDDHSRRSLAPG